MDVGQFFYPNEGCPDYGVRGRRLLMKGKVTVLLLLSGLVLGLLVVLHIK